MDYITHLLSLLNNIVWGVPMIVMIFGVGLYLTIGLRFMPLFQIISGVKLLWSGRHPEGEDIREGEITPFNALMTSLSATIGTGNIAGVATAIYLGGPGALFWMWCTALVGMATKYSEAVCAVKYREKDQYGLRIGGPMYYIKNGLSKRWSWLGTVFAIFGSIAGFGIGNTVQANSVANALEVNFSIPPLFTGLIMMFLIGLVLIGGIRRIAVVAGKLVPFMAFFYLGAGLTVIFLNLSAIPSAISLIIESAFSSEAATGGAAGATVWAAMHYGVARGIFSNEAGLGSAPIAHAAAQTHNPVKQGLIAMLGTFIDTLVLCSITGLAIIVSGTWDSGVTGAALTSKAFGDVLPGIGNYIVAISLSIFAFTTILGWSYYSEKCVQYLFGVRVIWPYRFIWVVCVFLGATSSLDFVWLLADTLNVMMAIPNLIALVLLSPVIFNLTKEYFVFNK